MIFLRRNSALFLFGIFLTSTFGTFGEENRGTGPIRVLFLEDQVEENGALSPGSANLVRRLMRDFGREAIYFDLADTSGIALPERETLFRYDVALVHTSGAKLDDSRLEIWKQFVEKGGGLISVFGNGKSSDKPPSPGEVILLADANDSSLDEFVPLLKSKILKLIGEERRAEYESFLNKRTPLTYEVRDDIPNYEERSEPLPYQHPLSPEDSLSYLQAPVGWTVETFASEPQIVNPICLAWDEQGRLWVAETVDYPNEVRTEGGNDTIKILEDTDEDGHCDQVIVFAEGLNIPTSLVHWNGGIIVAQAPDFLFLKDTTGDGQADHRETILSGWGTRDTHAGPSNLRYGIDNWIYGTVGYSGFEGTVGGEPLKFGMGVFRLKPDGTALEFLHQFNNNTWGLGINAAGDVFGSTANRNPAFFGGIPESTFPKGQRGTSARMIADDASIYPVTPNIRQVDALGLYTAGAGYALATSDHFPPHWRDRIAFLGGPTGNLLGLFEQIRDGAGYRAINRGNLLASADEWFSPVAAEVGPDGNLWVADWYNFIIQHNPAPTLERGGYDAVTGPGNAHENPNRDQQHGRIYRAIWDEAKSTDLTSLADASNEELVNALTSDNQFWRLTAQRILVAQKRHDSIAPLKALVTGSRGRGAAHALWTLHGLGALDRMTHQYALLKPSDPVLKRNAIRAIPATDEGLQLFFDTAVVQDQESLVRLAAFTKLAHFPDRFRVERVARELIQLDENASDEWLTTALRAAGAGKVRNGPGEITGPNLLPNPSFETVVNGLPEGWSTRTYSGTAEHESIAYLKRSGERSAYIGSTEGADASLFATVTVKPDTDYRLGGWIQAAHIKGGRGAQLNAHEVQKQPRGSRTEALTRNHREWTYVETTFSSLNHSELTINLLFGGWGIATGKAWWDDVSLHEVVYEDEDLEPELTKGDPGRGRDIFRNHAVASCSRCHVVDGEGGPIGPALDGIASRKSEAYLLESLTDPQATMAEGFPAEVSPMPPMGVLLDDQELRDVMAFLMTLKN